MDTTHADTLTIAREAVPQPVDSDNRMLATVETITSLHDIPDADNIIRARIRGWDVVVKRGEFEVGDSCVYFEVDSLLDVTDERFAFLAGTGVRTAEDGRSGHVLKTRRLRGQYSQGLAMPVSLFPEIGDPQVGDDVTAALDVVKWDPPLPDEVMGTARGMRPAGIPATGEDRIQNAADMFALQDLDWVATEKIDGESTSFYVDPAADTYGVCTRRLDLIENPDNRMWRLANDLDIHARLRAAFPGSRVVVQGETYGEGTKNNPLRLQGAHFAAFTLRVDGVEVPRSLWPQWLLDLSVPVHDLPFPASLDEALAQVETLKSKVASDRAAEGLVWRAVDRTNVTLPSGRVARASFKVISNKYLLKNDR